MTRKMLHFAVGKIVPGFQRGSQIGIPTANFELSVVKTLPEDFKTGIYCGWAQLEPLSTDSGHGDVHKMVMSVGWNPFFDNKEKSMETHILHKFEEPNLYNRTLKVCITTYLRPEANFTTIENLVKAINEDIENAKTLLEEPEFFKYKNDNFFKEPVSLKNGNCDSKNG